MHVQTCTTTTDKINISVCQYHWTCRFIADSDRIQVEFVGKKQSKVQLPYFFASLSNELRPESNKY